MYIFRAKSIRKDAIFEFLLLDAISEREKKENRITKQNGGGENGEREKKK